MIFLGVSVARNYFRPETAPLTIFAINRGSKDFKGRHFITNSGTDF